MCRPVARLPLRRCHRFSRRLRPALHRSPKPPLHNAVIWVRVEFTIACAGSSPRPSSTGYRAAFDSRGATRAYPLRCSEPGRSSAGSKVSLSSIRSRGMTDRRSTMRRARKSVAANCWSFSRLIELSRRLWVISYSSSATAALTCRISSGRSELNEFDRQRSGSLRSKAASKTCHHGVAHRSCEPISK